MSVQREVTRTTGDGLIESARQVDLLASDEYLWYLCGVDSRHHDMCRELVTTHNGLRVGDDEGIEGVHTDILDVDVAHQCMQHLTLCIAHVVL